MPGPARVGALIYAKNVGLLTDFYRELLAAKTLHVEAGYAVVQAPDMQLIFHAIPEHIANTIEISVPPIAREDSAMKLFFTVPSIEWAREVVSKWGGFLLAEKWHGPGFIVYNAVDPEGNIFQVRVFSEPT